MVCQANLVAIAVRQVHKILNINYNSNFVQIIELLLCVLHAVTTVFEADLLFSLHQVYNL